MSDVRIRVLKDGPYEVKGTIVLEDHSGAAFTVAEEPVYLCRCGQSATRPFCDGSHRRVGFAANEPAR